MYGRRAFAIAGTFARNSLPDPVRNPNATDATLRRLLKTFCSHGNSQGVYRVAQKCKPLPNYQKIVLCLTYKVAICVTHGK